MLPSRHRSPARCARPDGLRLFALRNKRLFFGADHPESITSHVDQSVPGIEQAEVVEDQPHKIRRTHDGDFRVSTNYYGIGVMPGMAPSQVTGLRMIMKQAIW